MILKPYQRLADSLEGDLHLDDLTRSIYATDASAYQEMPIAVAIPRNEADLVKLVRFAGEQHIGLIPRAAGTSLAGQVVGSGIVVDVSRHFTRVLEISSDGDGGGWVRVQPGVIRNELNLALQPHGLLFGPETSTQNRAMMGGMLGNNSCGSNSIRYGSVRDHVIEITALLSDGSKVVFGPLSKSEFESRCEGTESLERQLYRQIRVGLGDEATRQEIRQQFPNPRIPRRNTGYALDLLMDAECLDPSSKQPFNFAKLIAGSEGTLCFVLEMKLHCDPLPPPIAGLQCAQFESVDDALKATQIAVRHDCFACELIDRFILDCTKRSIEHRENRFFLQGSPDAVLVTEFRGKSEAEVRMATDRLESELRQAGLGYAYPVLFGDNTGKIWDLRKAGLGLLSNEPGDIKPVPVIEDTAVDVSDLPAYIAEFDRQLKEKFDLECVHYAHAGSGEIHLRPYLNLKTAEGHRQFREVALTVASLVKRYRGSLSGEHGDGRLRGEFLRQMIGDKNYQLVRAVKQTWDPKNLFNPGKIVDTPPMNESLRYPAGTVTPEIDSVFDWSSTQGVVRAAEMCNGSGDCRKTHLAGGTMCPSYMATRNEQDTTRARANTLRNVLTSSVKKNRFDDERLKQVLELCLSCKGCKKECPSTVDMAKLKAEFQQHYYDAHGSPLRSKLIANFTASQRFASVFPSVWNAVYSRRRLRGLLNRCVGFHPERTIPLLPPITLAKWFANHVPHPNSGRLGRVWMFNDEFTNYNDAAIGIITVELLERLGYCVDIPPHLESGRTWLSKGFVRKAKKIVNGNLRRLGPLITQKEPLVGIEPSAILTFRDEALSLVDSDLCDVAEKVAQNSFMLEEFLAGEAKRGRVSPDSFTDRCLHLHLHAHCHQKALAGHSATVDALRIPVNYDVAVIPSGCCGMAGSFGYEQEHYELSMQIAELVLLPEVRKTEKDAVIVAPGTSCRHQIHDGTGRRAMHPAEVLHAALID